DLNVIELRGNMATRLAVADRHDVDAVVAAAAALARLDLTQLIAERLDPNWFIPQIGQGALALEVRDDDAEVIALVESISHPASFIAVRAERAFLRELGAGCSIPAAAHASVANGVISLRALMAAVDGSRVLRGEMTGHDPAELGRAMAQFLRDESGGSELAGWRA
ncbi:MAG: hydroxymethylbilane synthase, partial [Actinomycetota bacterium]